MTKQINIHAAKTHFSQLLLEVQSGVEIIIAKAGVPIARLTVATQLPAARKPGSAKTRVSMPPNFDAPLPKNILDAFDQ